MQQTPKPSTVLFDVAPDVLFQEVFGEMVLLSPRKGMFYSLDSVGARVWELLRELGSAEKVISALLEEYEVSEESLRRDVQVLIGDLCEVQLLEPRDA